MSSSIGDLFDNSDALDEQRKINAELMLRLNSVRDHALENKNLKELLEFKDQSVSQLIPTTIITFLMRTDRQEHTYSIL